MPHGGTTPAEGFTYIDGETARQMRRPGTLPASVTSQRAATPSSVTSGIFCQGPSDVNDISKTSSNISGSTRIHANHSLRRNAPALPTRGDSCDRNNHQNNRIQNGGQQISAQRHSPPCPQSSYPTLPINDHGSHHYHHYRERDRSRDRSLSRDRELPAIPHRNDKHTMELELHENCDIGNYRG